MELLQEVIANNWSLLQRHSTREILSKQYWAVLEVGVEGATFPHLLKHFYQSGHGLLNRFLPKEKEALQWNFGSNSISRWFEHRRSPYSTPNFPKRLAPSKSFSNTLNQANLVNANRLLQRKQILVFDGWYLQHPQVSGPRWREAFQNRHHSSGSWTSEPWSIASDVPQ